MISDNSKNLWILTEERPKNEVLNQILQKFVVDNGFSGFVDNLRILPILENGKFTFTYELTGFRCNRVGKVFIKTVSGYSSFVDFLVFYQDDEPNPSTDMPIYVIEETKTDDSESRNTGCSIFKLLTTTTILVTRMLELPKIYAKVRYHVDESLRFQVSSQQETYAAQRFVSRTISCISICAVLSGADAVHHR